MSPWCLSWFRRPCYTALWQICSSQLRGPMSLQPAVSPCKAGNVTARRAAVKNMAVGGATSPASIRVRVGTSLAETCGLETHRRHHRRGRGKNLGLVGCQSLEGTPILPHPTRLAGGPERPRGAGAPPRRTRSLQPGDGATALDFTQNSRPSRPAHLRQDRCVDPSGSRHVRHGARPHPRVDYQRNRVNARCRSGSCLPQ